MVDPWMWDKVPNCDKLSHITEWQAFNTWDHYHWVTGCEKCTPTSFFLLTLLKGWIQGTQQKTIYSTLKAIVLSSLFVHAWWIKKEEIFWIAFPSMHGNPNIWTLLPGSSQRNTWCCPRTHLVTNGQWMLQKYLDYCSKPMHLCSLFK